MDQDPSIENEQDVASHVEQKESQELIGAEMLENPPQNDFIVGLKAFVTWVKSLVGKKD